MRKMLGFGILVLTACGGTAEDDRALRGQPPGFAQVGRHASDPGALPVRSSDRPAIKTRPGTPGVARLLLTTTPGVREMELDATHLYWVVDGSFTEQGEVWRADRETGEPELLALGSERVYAPSTALTFTSATSPIHRIRAPAASRGFPRRAGTLKRS